MEEWVFILDEHTDEQVFIGDPAFQMSMRRTPFGRGLFSMRNSCAQDLKNALDGGRLKSWLTG